MENVVSSLVAEMRALARQIDQSTGDGRALNTMAANWTFAGVAKSDLVEWVEQAIAEVDAISPLDISDPAPFADFKERIAFLKANTVQNVWNGNAAVAVPAIFLTLEALRRFVQPMRPKDLPPEVARDINRLRARVRSMQARLDQLDPQTTELDQLVAKIASAGEAADSLPEDLNSLEQARRQIASALNNANTDAALAAQAREAAKGSESELKSSEKMARDILERCDQSYAASTSQGLAKAFASKANTLTVSTWVWAAGLAASLIFGVSQGGEQLKVVAEGLAQGQSVGTLGIAISLALIKLGGPIWFAWLASKQVGYRFRLSEDYAFKAAISRAYEGYRKEAARVDPAMEARLLASALTRLDELPLRVVDAETHGSPWHELASSELVRKALTVAPEFVGQVRSLAASAVETAKTKTKSKVPASTRDLQSEENE